MADVEASLPFESQSVTKSCACRGIRRCASCKHLCRAPLLGMENTLVEDQFSTCLPLPDSKPEIERKFDSNTQPKVNLYDYCFHCQHAFPIQQQERKFTYDNQVANLNVYAISSAECAEEHHNSSRKNAFSLTCMFLTPDFITEAEEQQLIKNIDERSWVPSQSGRRKQDYGPKVNFKRRKVQLVKEFTGLPSYSSFILSRMTARAEHDTFQCVELCNLEYVPERESSIDAHIDDEWLWGERLVTVNLGADTYLTLTPLHPSCDPTTSFLPVVRVAMPRRSLFVMAGPSRHQWKHAIQPSDIQSRRIAMTFRELSEEFITGAQSDMGRAILRIANSFEGDVSSVPQKIEEELSFKVLSIQSHVVSGYVGNRCAVFPLQLLGFDVDMINTVQFSNHTAYSVVGGTTLEAGQLADIFQGLLDNHLAHYTHLLTGFIPNQELLRQVAVIAKKLKELNPSLIYVCDPVMGDEGELYVSGDVLQVYKEEILPLVDILTPNQYEIEVLTGSKITKAEDAVEAVRELYKKYTKPDMVVVISSAQVDPGFLTAFGCASEASMPFELRVKKIGEYFTGTGDLFAALLLAWIARSGDVRIACERTMATVQAVLQRTLREYGKKCPAEDFKPCFRHMELRLVQSKDDILYPKDFGSC